MRVISWEYEIYMQMSESCDISQSIKIHWSCLGILQICFSSRWAEQQMSAIYFVMKNIKDQPSKSYKGRTCYICAFYRERKLNYGTIYAHTPNLMKRSVTSCLIRASNYQYFSSFLLLPIFYLSDVDVDKSIIEFHQHSHILVEVSHKEFNREKINLPRMQH